MEKEIYNDFDELFSAAHYNRAIPEYFDNLLDDLQKFQYNSIKNIYGLDFGDWLNRNIPDWSSQNNCHICSVLHENKTSAKMRGHLGTELINKSETVLSVKKINDTSEVKAEYCRNLDFETFYFCVKDGLPEYCEPTGQPKNEDKLKELFFEILSNHDTKNYADLVKDYAEKAKKSIWFV